MSNITKKEYIQTVTLGDIISRIMNLRHITIRELSYKTKISESHISTLRMDSKTFPSGMRLSTINELAKALDVPARLLFNAPYIVTVEREENKKKK